MSKTTQAERDTASPPRGDCYRALAAAPELRGDDKPTMFGHFAEFETWTEVRSALEGHFFERVAPTAFAKTINEDKSRMRVLFHHGRDASVGFQVLGTIAVLEEDTYNEVELFESVPPLIMDGLRAGQYGSSYRFRIVKHEWVQRPRRSERNPRGIPELTILEARVREFGPTPIPQYSTGGMVGVRSVTDELAFESLTEDPERFEQLLRGRSMISVPDRHAVVPDEFEYRRSVETVGSSIWAITPDALAVILGIIGERANGVKPTKQEIRERIGMAATDGADVVETQDGQPVAVIPIRGPLVPRAGMFSEMSGATSMDTLRASFRAAIADDNVSAVLLDIDSPGGDAKMIPEMAAEIMAARGTKPIVAVANSMAASAAYWLAAAADELVVTPSGELGSIGVYTSHTDLSSAQEKAGIKTTLVSAGDYKVERNPFEPLSEDAQAAMQERVDAIYDAFTSAVASGRGVDVETVLNDFGKGRTLLAAPAVKAGMADRVDTFANTLARLQKSAAEQTSTRAEPEHSDATTPEPEPPEATTRPDALTDGASSTPTSEPLWGMNRDEEKPSWQL